MAELVEKKSPIKPSLAARFLKFWLDNRKPTSYLHFVPPDHLKNHKEVIQQLQYHRAVFLTQKKARVPEGERWRGIKPRIEKKTWNGKSPLLLEYESLVECSVSDQLFGSDGDRDILYSLRGFQLHSKVTVSLQPHNLQRNQHKVIFNNWVAYVTDRYDFDAVKYITLPNPDYGSTTKDAVDPKSETTRIPHKYLQALVKAGLACDYNVESNVWDITNASVIGPEIIAVSLP
jgi:hypothetical protein